MPGNLKINAVIFDLDGVIFFSEPLSHKAWNAFLQTRGEHLSLEEYAQLIGKDSQFSVGLVRKQKGLDLPPEDILREVWENKLGILREEAQPAPGVIDLLDALQARGVRIGLGSNSKRTYVDLALETMHLKNYFEVVVTADEVQSGKPAPDIYLQAAAALDQDPEHCLVIEDSPSGVLAAQKAGMRCVALPNPALHGAEFPQTYASYPDLIALHQDVAGIFREG